MAMKRLGMVVEYTTYDLSSVDAPSGSGPALLLPNRTDQFDSPDGAILKHRSFGLHEGRSLAAENPHMRVRRLLAHDRRDQAGHAADFNLDDVMGGLARNSSGPEGVCAGYRK